MTADLRSYKPGPRISPFHSVSYEHMNVKELAMLEMSVHGTLTEDSLLSVTQTTRLGQRGLAQ